jgi:hypothetical protein
MEMFTRIPEAMLPHVNLVLRNGICLSVTVVARFEEVYVVFAGREGGTSDERRGFFVPYDEISYIRIEKPVRVSELKLMYGETGFQDMDDRLDALTEAAEKETRGAASPAPAPKPVGSPIMPSDPAAIARQNLLDRIRAARANVTGASTSNLSK